MTGLEKSGQLSSTADMEKLDTERSGAGPDPNSSHPQSCSSLILHLW
jgi:hypothetical protein